MSFSQDMNQITESTTSRNVEQSFKKFIDLDPEAADFQNLIDSSLSEDTSLATFS